MKAGPLRTLLTLLSPPVDWKQHSLGRTVLGVSRARMLIFFKKGTNQEQTGFPHTHVHTHATLNKRHIFNKPSSICFEAHTHTHNGNLHNVPPDQMREAFFLFCFLVDAEVFPSGLNHIHHTLDRAPRLDATVRHANWKMERFLSPSYLTWIRALKSSILNSTVSQPQTHYRNACGGKDVTAESENVSICYRGPSCLLFSMFQLA